MRRPVVLLAATAVVAGLVPAAVAERDHGRRPALYLVGGDAESINPTTGAPDPVTGKPTENMLAEHFNLGGYGFGSGKVGNQVGVPGVTDAVAGREATSILADGVHSRSFAVSDGTSTVVLSQIETQGYFNAYKQGPFGENEIRKDASAQIAALAANAAHGKHARVAPVPTPSQIVVDSDHSHGGPDTAGVWGGVPTSYLKLVHDRTVLSIVNAWKAMQPAVLSYGVAHAGVSGESQYPPQECAATKNCTNVPDTAWLLHNQFAYDPNNQTMDDEVRVLQARDPDTGEVLDTYVNFSAHPTVLGSDNTGVTGDYVGRLNDQLQQAFGGFAMDQVGTLGRTQPNRTGCDDPSIKPADPSKADATPAYAVCELDEYAARVVTKVKEALAASSPFTGKPVVAMNSYLLDDPTTSAVLAGIVYAGQVIGAPAARAANAPWYTGSLVGTSVYSGRIGNVLVSGGPGEMYPQIVQKVRDLVTADNPDGIKGYMNIGTAGDFLGYIIAPLEAYPEPAYSSVANHDTNCNGVPDPAGYGCPDPVGNDNYFFNISHTFGERLTCDLLRGAGDVLLNDSAHYWSQYERCPLFASDFALPAGQDTQFPPQPDLSGLPTFDHM